jgi:molybdenum cofactor cytidylyltransferase
MGRDKLNLHTILGPLGSLAFHAALQSRLDHIFVVTKSEYVPAWITPIFFGNLLRARWTQVICRDIVCGQSNSLRHGVLAAQARGADAVMILLADQPLVSSQQIDELLLIYEQNNPEPRAPIIAASSYDGILCPPVLFSRSLFTRLLALQGDRGAKEIMLQEQEIMRILYVRPELLLDIDTEEDYERLMRFQT